MNRKVMRKSTLISSIAMLLVAVLALSGVTFAWFSTQSSAQTSELKMKAAAASGLYVAGTDKQPQSTDWSSNLGWGTAGEFKPASAAFYKDAEHDQLTSPVFYSTTSDLVSGEYNKAKVSKVSSAAGNDQYYVEKHIWVASDSEGAVDLTMTLDIEGSTFVGYERMAIVDLTDTANPVLVHKDTHQGKVISFVNDTDTANAIIGFDDDARTIDTYAMAAATLDAITFEDVVITKDAPKHFVVYFWFEGQDAQCRNELSGAMIDCNIIFSLPTNN